MLFLTFEDSRIKVGKFHGDTGNDVLIVDILFGNPLVNTVDIKESMPHSLPRDFLMSL